MSDLSPECDSKRTFANASNFIGSRPNLLVDYWRMIAGGFQFPSSASGLGQ
jgi:hypothetical protein